MTDATARADWDAIQSLFPIRRLSLGPSWNIGISSRLSRHRIMTLLQRSGAGNLDRLLADRSLSRIKTLRTFAVVNQEQASAAFRITVVANVTIPVVIITVLNLIFPGSPADMFRSLFALNEGGTVFVWLLVVAYLSLLAGGLGFGIANLSNARDIRHLIDLHAAERGIFFGLEDEDALQSG